jgi:hypothetical protein
VLAGAAEAAVAALSEGALDAEAKAPTEPSSRPALALAAREAIAASALAAMNLYGTVAQMCDAQTLVLSLHREALDDAAAGHKRAAVWQAGGQPDAKRGAAALAAVNEVAVAHADWAAAAQQQQHAHAYATYYQQQGYYTQPGYNFQQQPYNGY